MTDTQREADRFTNGHAETTMERIAEEDGRWSSFVAATDFEGDDYYIKGYDPQGDILLIHKETHEIFSVDVWITMSKTGDIWYAEDDESEAAVAERKKVADRAERHRKLIARMTPISKSESENV